MDRWTKGYTRAELDAAQERYDVRFPPDLLDLYLDRQPANSYDWSVEDPRIREMLNWPFEKLLDGIERGFWWPDWGDRPQAAEECVEVLRKELASVSRLIPLIGHRFLPETPHEAGNPIFSVYGFDTIYYGANLEEYFAHEFELVESSSPVRHIPFWSNIAEDHRIAYAYYAEASTIRDNIATIQSRLRDDSKLQ